MEPVGHDEVCRFVPPLVWILDDLLSPTVLGGRKVWKPSDEREAELTLRVAPLSLLAPLGNIVPWRSPQQKWPPSPPPPSLQSSGSLPRTGRPARTPCSHFLHTQKQNQKALFHSCLLGCIISVTDCSISMRMTKAVKAAVMYISKYTMDHMWKGLLDVTNPQIIITAVFQPKVLFLRPTTFYTDLSQLFSDAAGSCFQQKKPLKTYCILSAQHQTKYRQS